MYQQMAVTFQLFLEKKNEAMKLVFKTLCRVFRNWFL